MLHTNARSKIFQAALRLFAENGGADLAVSDLADAAGLARGTIYNNIENPDALFADVASALSHEMIVRVEETMRGLTDPAERLATGMRLFVRRAHEEQDWGRFLVRFAMNHGALQGMMVEPPVRDIARAIESGRFKAEQAKLPALVIMLTGATIAAVNAVVSGHQTWREAGSATAELFLRAGGVSTAEARRIAQTELPALAPPPAPKGRTAKRKKP